MVQMVLIIYISFSLPIRIGFSLTSEGFWYALDILMDLYFVADIFVNFRTAIVDEDFELETNKHELAMRYLKGWFFIDLIAVVPLDHVERIVSGKFACAFDLSCSEDDGGGSGQYLRVVKMLRLVRLMKLLRLVKVGRLLERYEDALYAYKHIINLLGLLVVLVFLGHIIACLFYFVSSPDFVSSEEKALAEELGLQGAGGAGALSWMEVEFGESPSAVPLGMRYVGALYWSFTTLTTVGYGDISANTQAERVFAILGMILGGLIFSIIIGSVSQIVQNSSAMKRASEEKVQQVNAFVTENAFPKGLRKEIVQYFRKQDIRGYSETEILAEIPFNLREAALRHLYKDTLATVAMFFGTSDVFKMEVASQMLHIHYSPGQLVYSMGEPTKGMYIIARGAVEVLIHKHKDSLETELLGVLAKGATFGEDAMLGCQVRMETVRIRAQAKLLYIDHEVLGDLCRSYPAFKTHLVNLHHERMKALGAMDRPLDQSTGFEPGKTPRFGPPEPAAGAAAGGAASLQGRYAAMHRQIGLLRQALDELSAELVSMSKVSMAPDSKFAGGLDRDGDGVIDGAELAAWAREREEAKGRRGGGGGKGRVEALEKVAEAPGGEEAAAEEVAAEKAEKGPPAVPARVREEAAAPAVPSPLSGDLVRR